MSDVKRDQDMLVSSNVEVPHWWISNEEEIQKYLDDEVTEGEVKLLSTSPGGRRVRAVIYGAAEAHLKGTANFNSALGGKDPNAYYRRGPGVREKPVLVILAGIHGSETEGIIAAMSIINLMEKGRDLEGNKRPELLAELKKLRLICIPLANPDGRVRVPYKGWIGLETKLMTRYAQGTHINGEAWTWPKAKLNHPMKKDVGLLGAYFDDNGINMMHDEWFSPMSETTAALLKLAQDEGPDMVVNLHSCAYPPEILETKYVPFSTKVHISEFSRKYVRNLAQDGYRSFKATGITEDGAPGQIPPAFNLDSALYHAGVSIPLTFESPHGFCDGYLEWKDANSYHELLDIHHILIKTASEYLLSQNR